MVSMTYKVRATYKLSMCSITWIEEEEGRGSERQRWREREREGGGERKRIGGGNFKGERDSLRGNTLIYVKQNGWGDNCLPTKEITIPTEGVLG